jgi:hypothetical protein
MRTRLRPLLHLLLRHFIIVGHLQQQHQLYESTPDSSTAAAAGSEQSYQVLYSLVKLALHCSFA